MSGATERLDLRGDLSELDRLFVFLHGFCERHALGDECLHKLSLVVEELAVNVMEHGYAGQGGGGLAITLRLGSGTVEVGLEDEAPAFDVLTGAKEPDTDSGIGDRAIGGLGLHLVKTLTRRRSYRHEDGKNIVWVEIAVLPD